MGTRCHIAQEGQRFVIGLCPNAVEHMRRIEPMIMHPDRGKPPFLRLASEVHQELGILDASVVL